MSAGLRDALAGIPGWEAASWQKLDGGETNRTWLIEQSGRRAVLKVDPGPRNTPAVNDRCSEAHIQGRAAEAGIANRVLYAAEGLLLSEYVEGTVWSGEQLREETNVVRIAGILRRLHGLPRTGRTFDAQAAADHYRRRVRKTDPELAEHCHSIVRRMPAPTVLCCCHNDLVAANILEADTIRLLDWEYAADNDPLFDLATIVAHHRLDAALADTLLDAYFDGDGRRFRQQLSEQERLYEALVWLWQAAGYGGRQAGTVDTPGEKHAD